MQNRLPISKPLLLVLIGLIIGASLGLGSGYAVFYPSMVNERSQTIEERMGGVEDNVNLLGVQLDAMNSSLAVIGDNLDSILVLSDVIDELTARISSIEGGQVTLNSELDGIEGTLNSLNEEFVDLSNEWDTVTNNFDDLETAYEAANNELESVQALLRENDGVRIYTAYMANPSSGFKEDISNEVYDLLIVSNPAFGDWVGIYSETTAKLLLRKEIDNLMGELVWNPSENTEVGSDSYQVKLETYFNFEFTPAGITVSKMHIEVRGKINIDTGAISQKTVSLAEIV